MDLFRKYPAEVQQETFQKLISRAQETEWGKKYGYASVKSTEDFQSRVPLQSYDEVKLYIDRHRLGKIIFYGLAKLNGLQSPPEQPMIKASLYLLVLNL